MERRGLRNLRNTCSMNSVFQSLFGIEELKSFFSKNNFTEGILKEMKDLFENLNKQGMPLEPTSLIEKCYELFEGAQPYTQQDAQEFFYLLIANLESSLEALCKHENIIKEVFYGEISSKAICKNPKNEENMEKIITEEFLQLSLPIQNISKSAVSKRTDEETEALMNIKKSIFCFCKDKDVFTINDCLREYFHCFNEFYQDSCIFCGEKGTCKMEMSFKRFPKYLVFCLKRFDYVKKFKKINKKIYALKTINIGLTDEKYELVSVIEHTKFFSRTHYRVYCKDKSWVQCNDSKIKIIPEANVLSAQPYIMIYKHVSDEKDDQSIILK